MANHSGDPSLARMIHHPEFYIRGGDTTFVVESHLFRVHRYFLERESTPFRTMLSTPAAPGEQPKGTSDQNAFVLDHVKSADFALFLWVFYNPKYSMYDATLDEWIRILKLAQHWKFMEVENLVTRELEKLKLGSIEKIVTYHEYGLDRSLLIPSYASICERAEPISPEEGNALGMQTVMMLTAARERARCNPKARGPLSPAPVSIDEADTHAIIGDIFGLAAPSPSTSDPPPSAGNAKNKQVNGAHGKKKN